MAAAARLPAAGGPGVPVAGPPREEDVPAAAREVPA
jgi:hypothetical protein